MSASFDCFSLFRCTHTALAHGSRADKAQVRIHPTLHAHVSSCCERCFCSLRLLHSLLLLLHLSDHPVLPTARQLQLPLCGGQIPCALPLRTLAPWPRTIPLVMSLTTTSMSKTPRNPRSSSGPRMTSTTMTSPSADAP